MQEYLEPRNLERYAFWWTEARLVLAAIALLLGGIPAVFLVLPGLYGVTVPVLKVCWLLSGVASLYLGYRWYVGGQRVFGGRNTQDVIAFWIAVVSGINLGLTGLIGNNIGMTILSGRLVFIVVALIYLWSAWQLYTKWNKHGQRIF